jgi:protein TonB
MSQCILDAVMQAGCAVTSLPWSAMAASICLHLVLLVALPGPAVAVVQPRIATQLVYLQSEIVAPEASQQAQQAPTDTAQPELTRQPRRRTPAHKPTAAPTPAAVRSHNDSSSDAIEAKAPELGPVAGSSSASAGSVAPLVAPSAPRTAGPALAQLVKLGGAPPEYPLSARLQGKHGIVRVRLLVNEQGLVQRADVLFAKPQGVFEQAALAAVRTWRFAALQHGSARMLRVADQDIAFELDE